MNFLRRLLYHILGKRLYFRVISKSFLVLYRLGILYFFRKFKTHYLISRLIRKNDVIIDIGANLGYYTSIFARKTGAGGKVYAVEPVDLYRDILRNNTGHLTNIELVPYALSNTEGESLMGITSGEAFRHGLTELVRENSPDPENRYTVETRTPETLFSDLNKLDYIKCDIEGHEINVIPGFKKLIEKYHPVIQIEIEKRNFEYINNLLTAYNYKPYIAHDGEFIELDSVTEADSDIIYLPENRNSIIS